MKQDMKLMAVVLITMCGVINAFANDVYIEQAGSTSTFNITQTGTGNRIGTASSVSTFTGTTQTVDIVQTGSNNTADLTVNGSSSTINYSAIGDTNALIVDIDGGSGTTLNIAKEGDSNRITVCGTNNAATATAGSVTCSSGVAVNDTESTINVKGDSNNVNLALGSPNAINNINIGQTTPSSFNNVNVTQTGATLLHNVGVTINGDTNTVNIKQQ